MRQDLRYAVRVLRSNPGFTAVAVLTLALGIGANTAMFSLVNAVVLRLLPVQNPEELVLIQVVGERGARGVFSYPFYTDLRDRNQVLSGLIGRWPVTANLSAGAGTERVVGELVTGNYFSVLGVRPVVGRLLSEEDDRVPDGHPVCVVSYGLWQRRFGGDPGIVGRTVLLNGRNFTVLGVWPASFTGTEAGYAHDIRVPLMMQRHFTSLGYEMLSNRRSSWLQLIGRLKPGMRVEQARAGLEITVNQFARELKMERFDGGRVILSSGSQGFAFLRARFEKPLLVLMAIVGGVLLIACANLANLLLARATARRREMAVRLALGAGRGRLVRQLLTESLLLALLGGVVGILAASWAVRGLLQLAPRIFYGRLELDASPDWRVLGFTFAASLLVGVLFGIAPALEATRLELVSALKDAADRARGRFALRKLLVVVQVALSLVLLIGAGLLIGSLRNLKLLDPGFRPENVVLLTVNPRLSGYRDAETGAFYDRLMERVARLPGVRSASLASLVPLSGATSSQDFTPEGYQPKPGEDMSVYRNSVGPGYFATMQVPVVLGREFTPQDRQGAPPVVIVNEKMAHRFWPGQNPIGKRIIWGRSDKPKWNIEVVGVVRDTKYQTLRKESPVIVYTPVAQGRPAELTLHIRTTGDPRSTIAAVQAEVRALDRNLPVYNVTTMRAQLDESLATERMMAALSGFFGGLALLLAAVGLYGVMAYAVSRRTREIGVRMALGAERQHILQLVLGESAVLVVIGLGIGLPAAYAASKLIASFLYRLSAQDPRVFAAVAAMLAGVGLFAAYLPARRAARIEPIEALRYE